ncbi:hypothetical protein [Pedobacter sp. UYP24]
MAKQVITEITIQELNRQKNILIGIMLGAGIVLFFIAGGTLYMVFEEGRYYMVLTIISCIACLIPGFIGLSEINKEFSRRAMAK